MSQPRGTVRTPRGTEGVCACGTRLSASNTGKRCAACERKFKAGLDKPPVMPRDFWYTDRFREAFESRNMGQVFRTFRTDERHKQAYGPTGIQRAWLASWLGLTQAQLSRIEQGEKSTDNLQVLTRWARTLSIPPELLWFDFPDQRRQVLPPRKPARMGKKYGKRTGLSYARKAVGLSQEQLAETMDVDRGTVRRWEAGEYRPQPYLWPKLAKILEISRDRLTELLIQENDPGTHTQGSIGESHIRHLVDGRLMAKIDGSVFLSGPGNEPIWRVIGNHSLLVC